MRKISTGLVLLVTVFLYSCKTGLSPEPVSSGSCDFSRYVAIGNSLTAGFADGALSLNGQMNCYPKMLSEQFALAGGGEFRIPFMNDGGGNDASGNPRLVLAYTQPCGYSSPTLSPILDPLGATALHSVSATGPYNLVGVPGARSIDAIFPLYSSLNPFLGRFCQTPGTSTMLSEALRINPSFFTLWLGSNDVLLYALGGAVPPVTIYDPSITDSSSLRAALTLIVDTLTKNGAKGAIANVPDITSVPYFTTVPWNGVVISQGLADTLNVTYATAGLSHITWKAGANGFVIVDSSSPGAMRHATSSDLILLSTPGDSLRCGQWGVSPLKPLKDKYVLSVDEIAEINEYSTRYNATIANLASQYKLALVDMKAALKNLKSGMVYNGITLNTAYVSGGAFSLDGVHPNPRGYALLANEFIRAINLTYKSTIPQVDVTRYTGVLFP